MIGQLFSNRKSFTAYPVKVLYDFTEDDCTNLKAGVTVSSRNFKKAVQRNRIKRIVREAYRVQKNPLEQLLKTQNKSVAVFFIYTGKVLPSFADVQKCLEVLLQRLINELSKPAKSI